MEMIRKKTDTRHEWQIIRICCLCDKRTDVSRETLEREQRAIVSRETFGFLQNKDTNRMRLFHVKQL